MAETAELRDVKRLLMTIRYYAVHNGYALEELRVLVSTLAAVVEALEAT